MAAVGVLLSLALILFYLLPGLLAVLVFRPTERASTWVALGAPVAVAIQIGVESALKIVVAQATNEHRMLATAVVVIGLFIASAALRRFPPVRTWADGRVLIVLAAVPLAFLVFFHSAIFERELTSDGVETLAMARSLDTHVLPRWPSESGLKGFGSGLIALAYPNAFMSFLGPTGPRVTFLMFLGVIAAAVIALVEARRERQPGPIAACAIGITVLAIGVTLGLDVSFDPYFADPANPGGAETMAVAMMLAAFVALLKRRTTIFLLASLLAYATLPSGLLFLAILGAATYAVARDKGWAVRVAGAILLCVVAALVYEKGYVPNALTAGLPMDAGSESLAGRLRLLIFTDVARLAFLVIPCGIVPFFFLFAWKKQDNLGRIVTLVVGALFLFFFVLATYSPHYFAPAMALAPVPYWRWARSQAAEWVGLAGAVVAVLLSVPFGAAPPQPYAAVGQTIRIDGSYRTLGDVRVPADLLQRLAWLPWDGVDASAHFVASGLQLAAYASSWSDSGGNADADWVVQRESEAPQPGYEPIASQAGWALFAKPGVKIEAVRDRGHPTDFQPPWYRVPREALFRGLTEKSRRYDLDLRSIFKR